MMVHLPLNATIEGRSITLTRTETLEQDRAAISSLSADHGLKLLGRDGANLIDQAQKLQLIRKIMSPSRTVIACSATLKDRGPVDPCLIVPASLPLELLPAHKTLAVGGQVLSIGRSPYALSSYLTTESWRNVGFWNGQPLPSLVAVRGEFRYLVRPKSYFFHCNGVRGAELDQLSPMEPDGRDLKLNRYIWADSMASELTLVIADY